MTTKFYTEEGELSSSALTQYWYDSETGDLFVEFPSGQVAGYKDVPQHIVNTMLRSDSVGRYYAQSIKNVYNGQNGDVNLFAREVPKAESPSALVGNYNITFTATMVANVNSVSMEAAIASLKSEAKASGIEDLDIKSVTYSFA